MTYIGLLLAEWWDRIFGKDGGYSETNGEDKPISPDAAKTEEFIAAHPVGSSISYMGVDMTITGYCFEGGGFMGDDVSYHFCNRVMKLEYVNRNGDIKDKAVKMSVAIALWMPSLLEDEDSR